MRSNEIMVASSDPRPATPASVQDATEKDKPFAKPARSRAFGAQVVRTLKSLTFWIFFGIVAGIVIGIVTGQWATDNLQIFSKIWLNLLKSAIAPLIISSLVAGIAPQAGNKGLKWLVIKTFAYFEVVTTIALVLGVIAGNVARPGAGMNLTFENLDEDDAANQVTQTASNLTWQMRLQTFFPTDLITPIQKNLMIQIVLIAAAVGFASMSLEDKHRQLMVDFMEMIMFMMFKIINYIMWLAPIGIGAAMAAAIGHTGLGVILNLMKLVLTLYVSLVIFVVGVLLPIAMWFKISIKDFIFTMKDPIFTAFASASSDAALPSAMEALERFGCARHIIAFVMPVGYSFNLAGTTLYLSLAALFTAQATNVTLTITEQLIMMLTLVITSNGVAAVPRASLVILAGTCEQFGLDARVITIILGVDEFMDMARTVVNLIGNCLGTCVIAKWEGQFDEGSLDRYRARLAAESQA